MGRWCFRAVATIWCRCVTVSCSCRVSASRWKSLPSGWRKSLYGSMSTMAVGASWEEEEIPGTVYVDISWMEESGFLGFRDRERDRFHSDGRCDLR